MLLLLVVWSRELSQTLVCLVQCQQRYVGKGEVAAREGIVGDKSGKMEVGL